jgi:site-specific DNA recombinase
VQDNNHLRLFAHYGRVSTTDQKDNGTSLETQLQCALIKARELGGTIPDECTIQEDWSGTDLSRPGLQRLYRILEAGKVEGVIIHTLDRLYRPEHDGDEWHIFQVLQRIRDAGVEIIWTDSTVPSQGPMTAFFTFLNSWRSGQERRAILERTRRGRLAVAGNGGLLGGFVPYGYTYVPRTGKSLATLEINEEQACHVREIYRLLVKEQLSIRAIAIRLTEAEVPTSTGKRVWAPSVINYMVHQEVYCGVMHFNRREPVVPQQHRKSIRSGKSLKSSCRLRPREEWIPIAVPAVIPRETWEAAQVQLRANSRFSPRNNCKRQYLLTGLVKCGICGKGYSGSGMHKGSREYRYYFCSDKYPTPASGVERCASPTVSADVIEQVIWETVSEVFDDPNLLREEFHRRNSRQPLDATDSHRDDLLAEQTQLKKKIDRFLDLYGNGKFDVEALNNKVDQANLRLTTVEKELQELQWIEHDQRQVFRFMDNLEDFCLTVREGLDKMTGDYIFDAGLKLGGNSMPS